MAMLLDPDFSPAIGVIGIGVVGQAICDAYGDPVIRIDIDPSKNDGTYDDLMHCDGIFVCVPSPQLADGRCDTSILEKVLADIAAMGYDGVIISKVTAPPDVYKQLGQQYKNLVYSPEFLTAANAARDYINGELLILGGSVTAYIAEAKRICIRTQRNIKHTSRCKIEEAALLKYSINSFLALKVIFMNELYELAQATGINYDTVADMLYQDPRIGRSHLQVPGPDGQFGFGGMCFPKDTSALLKFAEEFKIELSVLETAVRKNTLLRLS